MKSKLRLVVAVLWVFFAWSFAQASIPITVFPDPAQFGTVAENVASYPLAIYITNSTSDSVVVTGITISGANSANFVLDGSVCVGTLLGNQTCQTNITFTPTSIATFSANLLIAVQGVKQPIAIPLQGTGGNPVPTITSLSPASVYVNGATFTLTVNGTNFTSGAVIEWENTALPTTYISSTKLTAQVPASYLTETDSDFVVVVNPPPAGGSSGFVYFYIVALDPYLGNASPTSVVAGTAPSSIVLNGDNFMTGATVNWNGKALPTTYVSSGQLEVTPTAAELASASIVQMYVSNPAPGGVSSPIIFDVTYPAKVTVLDLPANDLVWDPYAQRIYATLPSSYGSQGNTIGVINPATGRVTGYYFAGSEPNQLALSSDSKYLYAGLNGNGSIQRFVLPALTPDINISLGTGEFGLNTALNLQVSPGDSHTIAVAVGTSGCCGSSGLDFYTDATLLPDSITYPTFSDIVFPSATTLYGYEEGTLSQVAVNSSGGTLGTQWNGLVEGTTIQYAAGLIYGSAGEVLNPATGQLLGSYDVTGSCCSSSTQLLADPAIGRVYALGTTPFYSLFGITSYNLSKFTPIAVANLSQLSGNTTPTFIPWGNNGLAFLLQSGCCGTTTNQVVLVQSPSMLLTAGGAKNPPPVAQSLSPSSTTHAGGNFPLTVKGTGFVPGSLVTWNGTALAASYVSATQLTVYVPASDVASVGTAQVVVTNPAPGGGTSGTLTFSIN